MGCKINSKGNHPDHERIKGIKEFKMPEDYSELRRFLGMANYYRRFVPRFSTIISNAQELISKYTANPKEFKMTQEAKESIENIKSALENHAILQPYKSNSRTFQLVTDASAKAIGGALHQIVDGKPRPIGFFSKKLTDTQKSTQHSTENYLHLFLSVLHFKSSTTRHSIY